MTCRSEPRAGAASSAAVSAPTPRFRDSAISIAGAVGAQAAHFLCIVQIARAHGPNVLGAFNFQFTVGTLAGTLLALRYDLACLNDNPRTSFEALANVLALAACTAGIGMAAARVAGYPSSALLAAFALSVSMHLAVGGFLCSLRHYGWIAASKIAVNVLFAGALLATPAASIDPFAAYALASSAVALAMLAAIARFGMTHGYPIRVTLGFFKEHGRFPFYILPSTLCAAVLNHALSIVVPLWFDATDAGQFAAAWRLGFFPVSLLGLAIGTVLRRDALTAAARADGGVALAALYAAYARALFALAFLYAIGSPWAFRPLVALFLGEGWLPAADFQLRLAPLFALQIIYVPLSQVFLAVRAQRVNFLFQLSCGAALIGTLLLSHRLGLPISASVNLFALTGAAMLVAGIALTHRCATTYWRRQHETGDR